MGTIFEEAMLRYTNWTQAFFCHGTFSRANLRHACMDEMIVRQVCFDGADLEGAKFWLTRFERSSLREANCSWTYLRGTVLHETDLTGTSFEKAVFWETGILNCPLHRARGLDQAYHVGRSFPDLQTIARAEGSLPPRFLRG
ncbi:pentapeptide repeat-containing protein, partial [Thermosporothrix hazakensis]